MLEENDNVSKDLKDFVQTLKTQITKLNKEKDQAKSSLISMQCPSCSARNENDRIQNLLNLH